MPIAGSMPCDFNHSSWDYEQYCTNDWAQACNYTCLYVLAALEPDRYSAQVIHEQVWQFLWTLFPKAAGYKSVTEAWRCYRTLAASMAAGGMTAFVTTMTTSTAKFKAILKPCPLLELFTRCVGCSLH